MNLRQQFVEDYIRTHPDAWEDWDEDMTLPKPVLMLRGASYKPSLLFDVEPHRDRGRNFIVSPGGHFAYANRILVPFHPLALLYRHYQVVFDAQCVLPEGNWSPRAVLPISLGRVDEMGRCRE